MPKFLICDTGNDAIFHEFEAPDSEEAKKYMARYMTGDGLPVSGGGRDFVLAQVLEGTRVGTEALWSAHAIQEAFRKR